jgi:hypothetical protein
VHTTQAMSPLWCTNASVNPDCADKHDAYPRASGRRRGPAGTANLMAFTRGARRTVRRAAAYIDTVMSENTGVHPVADKAVNPRITATAILLVRPDITHSIRPDCARLT